MAILWFDPKIQTYTPAERLLGPKVVKQPNATNASHGVGDKGEESPSSQRRSSGEQVREAYQQSHSHEPELVVRADQLMTSPVFTLPSAATLTDARRSFFERRVRHMPIVGEDKRLVGILSERDILHHPLDNPFMPVSDILTKNVLVATPDTSIRIVAATMYENRIGALPVINDTERPIGIITRSDILKVMINQAPVELWA